MIGFCIGFLSQFIFAVFRTVNVIHIAKDNLILTMISGSVVAFLWIAGTMVGIDAIKHNDMSTIVGYMIGANVGIIIAMRHKQMIKYFQGKFKCKI